MNIFFNKVIILCLFILSLTSSALATGYKIDTSTGIMWIFPESSNFEDTMAESWEDAIDFCNARGARLPNVIEFLSILNFKEENPALKDGFYRDFELPIIENFFYYTSTIKPSENYTDPITGKVKAGAVFAMNLNTGEVRLKGDIGVLNGKGVRCIRGG